MASESTAWLMGTDRFELNAWTPLLYKNIMATRSTTGISWIALLTAITGAGYDRAATDAVEETDRPPTLLAIDELCLISGFPALPNLLADGASGAHMLLYCCMQDLKQASRWGDLGEAFPTLFGNIIGIRGIRDKQTLELMSLLVGDFD